MWKKGDGQRKKKIFFCVSDILIISVHVGIIIIVPHAYYNRFASPQFCCIDFPCGQTLIISHSHFHHEFWIWMGEKKIVERDEVISVAFQAVA